MIVKTDNTADLAIWLGVMAPLYRVESLFEARCGDAGWFAKAGLPISYTGWDPRKTYIAANRKKYPQLTFAQQDVVTVHGAPPADVFLCRDMTKDPELVVSAAVRSGAPYLVTLNDVADDLGLVARLSLCPNANELGLYDLSAERRIALGPHRQRAMAE